MSNDKKYSPSEVAQMIKEKLQECLHKSEIASDLLKSANSSHEIDAGEEPRNDDAECPVSLGGSGAQSSDNSNKGEYMESAEYSEDSDMEDQPLDGSFNKEDEDEDEDEDKDKKEDDDSDDEEEYDFKKSEDCGYSVVYKSIKKDEEIKDSKVNPSFDREKKDKEWSKDQSNMINSTKPGKIKSNRKDQAKFIEEAKQRRAKMREEGALKSESDMIKEEIQAEMGKCGDMAETMSKKKVKK